jgi:hypothetical protein
VRQAITADRLDNLPVEPGTVILISPWVLHHHRQFWREPDVFAPECFLEKPAAIRRLANLPFGAGPRVCVGASLAVAEATIVLSTLLRAFRIKPVDSTPVLPVGAITTQPSRAPLFRLTLHDAVAQIVLERVLGRFFFCGEARPMQHSICNALMETLSSQLDLSRSRLQTLALLIMGMVNARTVNLSHLASQFPARRKLRRATGGCSASSSMCASMGTGRRRWW